MTPEEIDELVAEKVMGGRVNRRSYYPESYDEHEGMPLPHYSTDIAAAWQVVEKVRQWTDGHFTVMGFTTAWGAVDCTPNSREDIHTMIMAETAPMAICLAALKAKGVEVT